MVKHILIRQSIGVSFERMKKKLRTKLSCVLQIKCQFKHILNKNNLFINFESSIYHKIIISHLSLVSGWSFSWIYGRCNCAWSLDCYTLHMVRFYPVIMHKKRYTDISNEKWTNTNSVMSPFPVYNQNILFHPNMKK